MNAWNKFIISSLLISSSVIAFATPLTLTETKSYSGCGWLIERDNEVYTIKYQNSNGDLYENSLIITSDIEGSNLSLDSNLDDTVSLIMNYPRDNYVFKFTSGATPHIVSACKQITLSSINDGSATALTLCAGKGKIKNIKFSNLSIKNLLDPSNLFLEKRIETIIEVRKSFLYNEWKAQKKNRPYLIKGDVITVLEHKDSMLKIKYLSKSGYITAWIKLIDIL